ncbi:carotenoid oxygenase family protein [Mycobacteroides salmoniphilum]|uniref:Dioxygenase n=1 Tax=Mycobacteroides salmoniphilum TaxID=404941 RepID=A0A4R8SAN4_9MYCO|nr:carotenoid oxygenase family protein [Mycobacteroides salmoniphilum]TDZ91478.1 Carotenoid cleavage oxygenase [Mycobacteroides salmoniphilum]TEA00908.1 Carotenoid cleavage oxygenase [Mycobacteroides salmoniphilum]
MPQHPFLIDGFAPVNEETTLTDLDVTGRIPVWLDGRYLRNGPNPIADVDPAFYHWFMGDGMVHGVRLRNGKAEWYRNRWVRSRRVARRLGEPYRKLPRAGAQLAAGNTNIIGHAGKTLALVEGGPNSYELDEELNTLGVCDFDGTITGGYTAHPKRDPDTGELHALSYSFGRANRVEYTVIGVDGRARRCTEIEVDGSPMMHDFSLTEKHVIIYDLPVNFDTKQAVRMTLPGPLRKPAEIVLSSLLGRVRVPGALSSSFLNWRAQPNAELPYRWTPGKPARIGVMPREGTGTDVRWFEVEPCYVFHAVGAYDTDDDQIVIDVARHPRACATNFTGPDEGLPSMYRWTIDLTADKIREEQIDDRAQDFPRIDDRKVSKLYRYAYALSGEGERFGNAAPTSLIKHDLAHDSSQTRAFGSDAHIGEFVFVPEYADAEEDRGVLMGFVLDRRAGHSNLVVLDAQTLETVAEVHLPVRVPAGFHGNWLPTD